MARIFTDGAEDPEWNGIWTAVVNSFTRQTSPVASGLNAYRAAANSYAYKTFPGILEGYFRVRWRISTNYFEVGWGTVQFRNGGTMMVQLGLDTTYRKFQIYVGSTLVATGSFTYNLDTWYLLEFHIKIDDTVGVVQLKVDGKLDIDFSGDTKPGTATTIDSLYLYALGYTQSHSYFDDIAINNVSGTADNSWCGEGRIIYLVDNAAGDVTELTPNTGANYAAVDETTADGDTTYVEGATLDLRDLYNLADSGLAAGSTIKRVIPVASARDTVANGGKIALGLKTNGTEYFGSDIALTTNYAPVQGTEYLVNPNTGVAFTIAEIDAMQVGVKVRGT